ncbi:MAG: nucleotidyltransferase domain-containing protein [Gemmatimonadota bacterium]|nr:MAG: nucleotidyltransferase domain-containing protein [Gemmatimonadota bacterium]
MAKIPKIPEEIFSEFCDDLKRAFGNNLVSVILFGSGARGEYIPKKSDLNFLIVVKDNSPSELIAYRKCLPKWRKRNVSTPLFLTEGYIRTSLDTFPVEFQEMKSAYEVIHGEDLLADLSFDKSDLRVQAERELKGKLLHLRQEFLESQGKVETLTALVSSSLAAFAPVFRALLYITDEEHVVKRADLLQHVCDRFHLNKDLFLRLLKIGRGEEKIPASEMNDLFDLYVEEIDKLSKDVDTLTV